MHYGKIHLWCQRLSFWYKLQSSLHMSLIHFRVKPPLEIWNLYLPFCAFSEQVCFYSLNSRVGFFLSYFFCKTYSVLVIWSKFHPSTTIFYEMEKYLNWKEFVKNVSTKGIFRSRNLEKDNAMAKRKTTTRQKMSEKIPQRKLRLRYTKPTKNRDEHNMRYQSYYHFCKPGDKSWMKKTRKYLLKNNIRKSE